jgi:hypothetical protein
MILSYVIKDLFEKFQSKLIHITKKVDLLSTTQLWVNSSVTNNENEPKMRVKSEQKIDNKRIKQYKFISFGVLYYKYSMLCTDVPGKNGLFSYKNMKYSCVLPFFDYHFFLLSFSTILISVHTTQQKKNS